MSLLFVYVVFGSYFAHFNYSLARCCLIAAVVATDVFLKSFIIVSTHRRRRITSETGFKRYSPNPNPDSDSLIECTFTESTFGFTTYPNPDSLIKYPLSFCVIAASAVRTSEPNLGHN